MKTILIIDDEQNIRFSVEICLSQAGYKVMTAEDGLTGLQMALEDHPDLILLDILLPKMNGMMVCEVIKNEQITKSIPILVMSAKAEEDDIKRAQSAGADDYLIKPFSPEELRKKVKSILEKECASNEEKCLNN